MFSTAQAVVIEQFETISLLSLAIDMEPTKCLRNIIATKFLKDVLNSIGSSLLVSL